MKNLISISNFDFKKTGSGSYLVTYRSNFGKEFTASTNNMPLIDLTKNADEPKKVDLNRLKRVCKEVNKIYHS